MRLLYGTRREATLVKLADLELGEGEDGFRVLASLVRQLARGEPTVRGEICADPRVAHREVVRVLDCFRAAGVDDISFVGTAPPRR